jgi:prepilin-type N-terminal cleavage/methylation domain-containing protein
MKKGFTLVELIIVVIIVGILASIGLTQYNKVVERGRATEARMMLGTLRSAELATNYDLGAYQDVPNLGVSAPTACATTHYFSYSCASATGTCTATRCTTQGKPQQGSMGAWTKTLDIPGVWSGSPGF